MNEIKIHARQRICNALVYSHDLMRAHRASDTMSFQLAAKQFNRLLKLAAYLTHREMRTN